MAHAPEQVYFIVQSKRNVVDILRDGCLNDRRAVGRTVSRQSLALSIHSGVKLRVQARRCYARKCTRFGEPRGSGFETLIVCYGALFVAIEFTVAEKFPPVIFRKRIP